MDAVTVRRWKRLRARWIAAGLLVGLVLVALVGGYTARGSTARRAAEPGLLTLGAGLAVGSHDIHRGPLTGYLLPVPVGARPEALRAYPGGRMTFDQVAAWSSMPAAEEAAMLREHGFLDGVVTEWWVASRGIVDIKLLRFDTVEHAVDYFAKKQSWVEVRMHPEHIRHHDVLLASETFSFVKPDSEGYRSTNSYADRGDTVIVLDTLQKRDELNLNWPEDLLLQQYNNL